MPLAPRILFCQCMYAEVLPRQVKAAALKVLLDSGQRFEAVADLCELAARRDPLLTDFAGGGPLIIAACYPRAIRWLFAAAGAPLSSGDVEILNLRVLGPQEATTALLNLLPPGDQAPTGENRDDRDQQCEHSVSSVPSCKTPPAAGNWHPWFPVIDFDRCTQCMQCLSFCLFGVYGVDERRRITVHAAENCKTNCPACSRVCPEAAIIFPKYKTGPINGDVIRDADASQEKVKVDISALLGGDLYSTLRARSGRNGQRFSKERDPDQALEERRRCLARLAELGEIPPEVLQSLPAPEEIQRRAEEAKAKAHAALGRDLPA